MREVVANAITFEMKDPRVLGVTVSDVEVTGDLREARVFVHVTGDQARIDEAVEALRRSAGWLRRKVGEKVRLRHIPRLDFRFDRSLDYGARIEAKLRELGLGEDVQDDSPEEADD
jgi:ribosome-binding factor A